jgi:hypothetical protein
MAELAQVSWHRVAGDLVGDDLFGSYLAGRPDSVEACHLAVREPVVGGVSPAVVPTVGHVGCRWARWDLHQQDTPCSTVGSLRPDKGVADDVERWVAPRAGDLVDRLGETVKKHRLHRERLGRLVLSDTDEYAAAVVGEGSQVLCEALLRAVACAHLGLGIEPVPFPQRAIVDGCLHVLDRPGPPARERRTQVDRQDRAAGRCAHALIMA